MEQIFPYVLGVISMITALSALWLSYRVYVRQRSLENENHFFKYKIEEYQTLVYYGTELVDTYYRALEAMGDHMDERTPDIDAINGLADSVDDKTDEFRLILQKHCAFIPKEIVTKLDEFYEKLSGHFENLDDTTYSQKLFEEIWNHLEKFEEELEAINDLMRQDLDIDAINRRLKTRTHSKSRNKK